MKVVSTGDNIGIGLMTGQEAKFENSSLETTAEASSTNQRGKVIVPLLMLCKV